MDNKYSGTSDSDVVEVPWRHALHAYYDMLKLRGDRRSLTGMGFVGCSSDRCLFLRRGSDYFLVDLESMKRFPLPHVEESEHQFWFTNVLTALTANPSDPDCGVLYIDTDLELDFIFYRLHDPRRLISRQQLPQGLRIPGTGPLFEMVSWVICFRGQIYFFTHPCMRLFRVEVTATSSIQVVLVTESSPENLKRFCRSSVQSQFFLVRLGDDDDLLLIHVAKNPSANVYHIEDIQLFKLDLEAKTWVEITSIGDNVIFISYCCACSMSTADFPCPAKRNSIYYLSPILQDRTLYIFDLEDGSITPYLPNTEGDSTKLSVLDWLSSQASKSSSAA